MNTRRYPRTMQEAFGPYTSDDLHEMKNFQEQEQLATDIKDLAVIVAGFLILAALIVFAVSGVIQ